MSNKQQNIVEYTADYRDKQNYTVKSTSISTKTNIKPTYKKDYIIKEPAANKHSIINNDTKKTIKINTFDKHNKKTIDSIYDSQTGCIKEITTKKQMGFYRSLLAGITMILSITGIIILLSAMNRTTTVINDSPTFTKYNNFLAPVVMNDPTVFNETEKADTNMIISSSIWRTLLQNGVEHYKEFDEQGLALIPVTDIQSSCTDLFGPTYTIDTNKNIYGSFYSYTPSESNFHIGAISNIDTYIPYTEEITEENDDLILTVAYLSRDDKYLSIDETKSDTPTPVKRMKYRLKINKNTQKFYIYSIENT